MKVLNSYEIDQLNDSKISLKRLINNNMRQLKSTLLLLTFFPLLLLGQNAQQVFNFEYLGPDTIYVADLCVAPLDWGAPQTPTVTATGPGVVLISFELFTISGGHDENDLIAAGENVTITYRAQDNMGNVAFFGFTIPFVDTLPPVFDPVSLPPDMTIDCGTDLPNFIPFAKDNCDPLGLNVTYETQYAQPTIICQDTVIPYVLLATDQDGNTASHTTFITIVGDTIAPMFSQTVTDTSFLCGDLADDFDDWLQNEIDNLAPFDLGCGLVDVQNNAPTLDQVMDSCGTFTIDFWLIDSCDNVRTMHAEITIIDTMTPQIIQAPTDLILNCEQADVEQLYLNWLQNMGNAVVEDDCSKLTWTYEPNGGLQDFSCGQSDILFIVTDACGFADSAIATITVIDTTAPTIIQAANTSILTCDAADPISLFTSWVNDHGGFEALDICTDSLDLEHLLLIENDTLTILEAISFFENSLATSVCSDSVLLDSLYFDNVLIHVAVNFIIEDLCGNQATSLANFAIIDDAAPSLILAAQDSFFNCIDGNLDTAFVFWMNSFAGSEFEDNCDQLTIYPLVELTVAHRQFLAALDTACFGTFAFEMGFYAIDQCGQQSSDTSYATFTYIDTTTATVINPAADILFDCSATITDTLVNWINNFAGAEVIDNCTGDWQYFTWQNVNGDTLQGDFNQGPYPNINTSTCTESIAVQFHYSDICQGQIILAATFSIQDTIAPIFLQTGDSLWIDCAVFNQLDSTAVMDNCSQINISFSDTLLTDTIGLTACEQRQLVYKRNWEITDACNNSNAFNQFILLIDTTGPSFILPADTVLYCFDSDTLPLVNSPSEIMDNCGGTVDFTYRDSIEGVACNLMILRIWTGFDICGNETTQTQRINLLDTTAPVWDLEPQDTIVNCEQDVDLAFSQWLTNLENTIATDACSSTQLFVAKPGSYNADDPNTFPGTTPLLPADFECGISQSLYTVEADVFAFDSCFNSITTRVKFSLFDETAPTFDLPFTDSTLTITELICMSTFELPTIIASDACGKGLYYFLVVDEQDTIMALDLPLTYNFEIGTHELKYVVLDCGNNITIQTALLRVKETITPELFCNWMPLDTFLSQSDCVIDIKIPVPDSFSDNCTDNLILAYKLNGTIQSDWVQWDAQMELVLSAEAGQFEVLWRVEDASHLFDSCQFIVNVFDSISPTSACQNVIFEMPPSGNMNQLLPIDLVDAGSFDNCGIDSIWLSHNQISCDSIGQEWLSTLYTMDASGNQDACEAIIRVIPMNLDPTFLIDICNSDTLAFFSNPPDDSLFQYTYSWEGPQDFVSIEKNPMLTNVGEINSGQYSVTVTGFNGCYAIGSVQVNITNSVAPIISSPTLNICDGDLIRLTSSVSAGDIKYQWFEGDFPNGLLLASTLGPAYEFGKGIGVYDFYVIVINDDCISNPSSPIRINVIDEPPASIEPALSILCEGDILTLSTSVTGSGFMYTWTGPSGFISSLQQPVPIFDVKPFNAGIYRLQVGLGSCASNIATAEVIIKPRPIKPFVPNPAPICAGLDLNLTINNILTADRYVWQHPNGSQITTAQNTLTLQNIDITTSGKWTVFSVVDGCESLPSDTFIVVVEQAPIIQAFLDQVVACEGEMMQLNVDSIPNAMYQWSGPNTFESDIRNPITLAIDGEYEVTLTTGAGCNAVSSVLVDAQTAPIIVSVSNDGLDCVNGTTDICFEVHIDPPNDGSYLFDWNGPNDFKSQDSSLCIHDATPDDNGLYTLIISAGGCLTNPVASLVELTDISERPGINGPNSLCEGDNLILTTQNFEGFGGVYHWLTPNGELTSVDSFLKLDDIQTNMTGGFAVFLINESCTTLISDPIQVNIIAKPQIPTIVGEEKYCAGDTIDLSVNFEMGVDYTWILPDMTQSQGEKLIVFPAETTDAGIYSLELSRGNCAAESSPMILVEVADIPNSPTLLNTIDSICIGQTTQIELCINPASAVAGGNYLFNIADPFYNVGDTSASLCQIITADELQFLEGRQSIQATTIVNGCASLASVPLQVQVFEIPEIEADAGEDITLCNELFVKLNASKPAVGYGRWIYDNRDVSLDDDFLSDAVADLAEEDNVDLVWALTYGSCKDYSIDSIELDFVPDVQAEDDLFETTIGQFINGDLIGNDQFKDSITLTLISNGAKGIGVIDAENAFIYTPEATASGLDEIFYELCSQRCPELCDQALISIQIGDGLDCTVPNIITPNNDGFNDYFIISCLGNSTFEENELIIFNELGDQVFKASPYQNDWQGTYKGNPVPEGTYFYVLKINNMNINKSGFIIVER